MLWRYYPIIITKKYSIAFHEEAFAKLCEKFSEAAAQCTISFVDRYRSSPFCECTIFEMNDLAEKFSSTAQGIGLPLFCCAEEIDLRSFGISPASCVDKDLCERLCGHLLSIKKDPNQRP